MELFVYGTLMVSDVMRGVCGYAKVGEPAQLNGFCRRLVRGEIYPAIAPAVGEAVDGLLYRGVTDQQTRLLDAFEGDFYERQLVSVTVQGNLVSADAYVLHPYFAEVLSDQPWSLEAFRQNGIGQFTSEYEGFDRATPGSTSDD